MKFKGQTIRVQSLTYADNKLEVEYVFVGDHNLVHGSIRHRILVTEDGSAEIVRNALLNLIRSAEGWAAKIHFDDVEDVAESVSEVLGIAETLSDEDSSIDDPA